MKHPKTKIITLTIALIVAPVAVALNQNQQPAIATSSVYCVSAKCKAAEAAEQEAKEKAASATTAANTLEDEVERLNDEIATYVARIATNEAIAEDLAEEIADNEHKLDLQQAALAEMLVSMHFEDQPDALMILASSSSISDFAEKQARYDSVKTQISSSIQSVKNTKEELEKQKAEVDRIVEDQKLQRAAIEEKRAEQNALIAKYQDNAQAFTAEAEQARKTKEQEIANEIARLNSVGAVGNGVNSYPYKDRCPGINLAFIAIGGYVCQCTSYAGWKVYERWGITISSWGNAYSWGNTARALGYRVDSNPEPGTVAVSTAGAYGHVMWVESVNANGTFNLSEYNNSYSSASHMAGDYGYRSGVSVGGLQFIHFN